MGTMRILLLMATMLVCMSVQASTQDSNQRTVLEFANTKCETWTGRRLRAARFADASHMESWAFGFVSGANVSNKADKESSDFLESVDMNAISAWLDEYCRTHPQEGFVGGVIALTSEMKQRAQRK